MPTPSLILVPARFKTGKLYTPVATTSGGLVLGASGDFNVTRDTTATRVNANGFIESVASGIPRLDYYTSGGTAGCPALLVEPSAQNTCLKSETFQSWSLINASGSSGNVAVSPSNTQTAGLFIPNSGTTGRGEVACGTLSNATTYSFSCFIKTPTNSLTSVWLYISDGGSGGGTNRWGVEVNLSNFALTDYTVANGSVTSKAVENYGNGWYRVRVTGQVTSGMSGSSVAVVRKLTAGADTNGINGVLVWGAQVETGSVATSYIPTTAAAVTRNADVVSVLGAVSGCIGQTEGTIYAEVDSRNQQVSRIVSFQIAGTVGSGQVRIETVGASLRCRVINASGTTVYDTGTISPSMSVGINKMAFAFNSAASGIVVALNGSIVNTGTASGSIVHNATQLTIGAQDSIAGFGSFYNDRIRAVAIYSTRLTNAELQSLTTL
jgi:hypothetical protein